MQSNSLCIGADNICHILPGRGNSVLNHMSADHVTYKVLQATLLISHSITKQKPHILYRCILLIYDICHTICSDSFHLIVLRGRNSAKEQLSSQTIARKDEYSAFATVLSALSSTLISNNEVALKSSRRHPKKSKLCAGKTA